MATVTKSGFLDKKAIFKVTLLSLRLSVIVKVFVFFCRPLAILEVGKGDCLHSMGLQESSFTKMMVALEASFFSQQNRPLLKEGEEFLDSFVTTPGRSKMVSQHLLHSGECSPHTFETNRLKIDLFF